MTFLVVTENKLKSNKEVVSLDTQLTTEVFNVSRNQIHSQFFPLMFLQVGTRITSRNSRPTFHPLNNSI